MLQHFSNKAIRSTFSKQITRCFGKLPSFFKIHPRIQQAIKECKPVVCLESTILSHGMPYPTNLEVAYEVEEIIRQNGAEPATIGIVDGKINVGLDKDSLELLARPDIHNITKLSRRDLALVKKGFHGSTTVAATMIIAKLAGLKVFVTGGIGGVHYGASESFDVSADLTELGRTDICVVSAGIKSILDIPKTLEMLETNGVTVCAYQQKNFPSFFSANSGIKAQHMVNSPLEVAQIIHTNEKLQLNSGMLIGVPIPKHLSFDGQQIQSAINKALKEVEDKGIKGREITPFLLERVNQLTKGKSLKTNIQLIRNNAKMGALFAKEYYNLKKKQEF
ncbi:hypothetical protein M0812_14073 [Anaeramoeba flamelloides]|uniref:Pseudouridine-5'-phosphate glycosidase n=1 Tax=Anaeramoeba flamelloides TaxID=1746091 RepID=A0AAV7ZH33_9EUKA|nr:hypothetical protein M0812_14073 [Anaeramoeba flamelloides]